MPTTYRDAVTAVGRILKPKAGEPHVRRTIVRRPDGTFRHGINRTITPGDKADV